MGRAIPTQHPAVVLRSHYRHVRIMLAIAMIAVVSLAVTVVILAGNDGARTDATSAADSSEFRVAPHARAHGGAPVPDLRVVPPPNRQRFDGGPEEGTRGIVRAVVPSTRYDGGPEEGTRGPAR
jgi:hypothetical protein